MGVGGGGAEGAGGAVDHHVVLAAVVCADPGYGGAGAADLEAGHGVRTLSPSPWPHLVVVTLAQAMLQYPSSCLMQAV